MSEKDKPCKTCGTCPTCGRSPQVAKPYWPHPYPTPWVQPHPYRYPYTITCGPTTTVSASTPINVQRPGL